MVRPAFLVRRPDGQVIQISALLQQVLSAAEEDVTTAQLARRVSDACGRELTEEGCLFLLEERLRPLGMVESPTDQTPAPPPPRARPILSLSMRGVLLRASWVRRIARPLALLYHPVLVVAALLGFVFLDVWLLSTADVLGAIVAVIVDPMALLGLYLTLVVIAGIHELGHAAACRYGGAAPGEIGFGLYLVFPAFYTDVTDSYRLNRVGRIRTDLGGLYFNVWCGLLLGLGYVTTGSPLLLFALVVMQIEMVQQLIPAVRFDGYFLLSDIAGVPDLFARVKPVFSSLLPGRPLDPRVRELRPFARRIVVLWVVVVIPLLLGCFGWFAWSLPTIVRSTLDSIGVQRHQLAAAWGDGHGAVVVLSILSVVLLLLPLLGFAVVILRLGRGLGGWLLGRAGARSPTSPPHTHTTRSTG